MNDKYITPALSHNSVKGLFGNIDLINSEGISGWLLDAAEPMRILELQAFSGDILISKGHTALFRPDISNIVGKPVKCGFNLRWEISEIQKLAKFSNRLPVKILHAGIPIGHDDIYFDLPEKLLPPPCPVGQVTAIHGSFVRGTCFGMSAPGRSIDLCVDGFTVASCYPQSRIKGEWEFRLVIPAELYDGLSRNIRICTDSGILLKDGNFIFDGTLKGEGVIDNFKDQTISGWAISWLKPFEPASLEIFIDGKLWGRTKADRLRPDIGEHFGTSGFNGFEIVLPREIKVDCPDQISIRLEDSYMPLAWNIEENDDAEALPVPVNTLPIYGRVEEISRRYCRGWAYEPDSPDQSSLVDIEVNGLYVGATVADKMRYDLATTYGISGRQGFFFQYPYGVCPFDANSVICRLRKTSVIIPQITKLSGDLNCQKSHHDLEARTRLRSSSNIMFSHRSPAPNCSHFPKLQDNPFVEIIILNRNGAPHLERLLESFFACNTFQNYKITVIDHASSDASMRICRKWATRLPIFWQKRRRNYSFSESNNYSAFRSTADILFFLNNDIIFCQDILGPMVAYITSGKADIVGAKLQSPPLSLLDDSGEDWSGQFIQHLGVHFSWLAAERPFLPYEQPQSKASASFMTEAHRSPAVSGGAMLIRRDLFTDCGGFHEGYYYGYEDVDLCLYAHATKGAEVVCANDLTLWHMRGATRDLDISTGERSENKISSRVARNFNVFKQRFGSYLRGRRRAEWFSGKRYFRQENFVIAFIVSKADLEAREGDIYTAFELGTALKTLGDVEIVYIERENWQNLSSVDVAIIMLHDFNPGKITQAAPNIRLIAWARNQFDAWLQQPWLERYDDIWVATRKAASAFAEKLGSPVRLMPIATNQARFTTARYSPDHASDYVFTGSIFAVPRQIMRDLRPDQIPYTFAIYGHGWENAGQWRKYWRGAIGYAQIPRIYASTRIVVDDANSSIINWGGINSRVFDALAAGALVITNSKIGSEELFEGLLPCYESAEDLTKKINYFLENENERIKLVERLKGIILQKHTYAIRADYAKEALLRLGRALQISIEVDSSDGCPSLLENLVIEILRKKGHLPRKSLPGKLGNLLRPGDDLYIAIGKSHSMVDISTMSACICLDRDLTGEIRGVQSFDRILLLSDIERQAWRLHNADALFRQEELEHAIITEGFQDWTIRDLPLFQKRLEIWVDALIADCLDRQENPERLPQPCHAEIVEDSVSDDFCIAPNAPTLFFWPDYSASNPYQRLLYAELEKDYPVRPGSIQEARLLLESGQPVAFHLHWTAPIMGIGKSREETEERINSYLGELEKFTRSGGTLLWTIHNALSHECAFPDLEMALYSRLGELASSIHLHSMTIPAMLDPGLKLPWEKAFLGPHGNYIHSYPEAIQTDVRARLGIPENAKILLFLGHLRSYKGLFKLFEAFRTLQVDLAERPGRPVWLLVAGQPGEFDIGELRKKTPQNCVIDARRIPDNEIAAYFDIADIMVLPYERILTSGSAILACSFGVPVLAPKLGLLPELLEHGRDSILYNPEHPQALVSALRQAVMLDDASLDKMKAAAYATARRADWDVARNGLSRAIAHAVGATWETFNVNGKPVRVLVRRPMVIPEERIGIAIIHYKNLDDTMRAVSSVADQGAVYVVSNDPDARAFLELCSVFPSIVVAQAPENLFYAGANNVLLRLMMTDAQKSGRREYDYALLMNNDMEMDTGSLAQLATSMDDEPNTAFSAPCIVYGDRPERVWFCGAEIKWDGGMQVRHWHMGENIHDMGKQPLETGYVNGACLMARMDAIKQIGLMREDFRLYFEEADWCLNAKKLGWDLKVFPAVVGRHFKRSDEAGAPSDLYLYYYSRNAFMITALHNPARLDTPEPFIRLMAQGWIGRIREVHPERVAYAIELVEKGINDGMKAAQAVIGN